jgi:hypothetical protein
MVLSCPRLVSSHLKEQTGTEDGVHVAQGLQGYKPRAVEPPPVRGILGPMQKPE